MQLLAQGSWLLKWWTKTSTMKTKIQVTSAVAHKGEKHRCSPSLLSQVSTASWVSKLPDLPGFQQPQLYIRKLSKLPAPTERLLQCLEALSLQKSTLILSDWKLKVWGQNKIMESIKTEQSYCQIYFSRSLYFCISLGDAVEYPVFSSPYHRIHGCWLLSSLTPPSITSMILAINIM